jgi:phosphoglycerate kinase
MNTKTREKDMKKLTIEDLEIAGRRVLMRVDFNVPLESGRVANDKRIRAVLPTIQTILEQKGKLILMSHLGRPKGKRIPEMSLKPCAGVLSALLKKEVFFVDDCIGEKVQAAVKDLGEGQVLLLENLRYYEGETKNDLEFAKKLAALGDLFVNDAFGTVHRAHASTEGVTKYIDQCAAGYLLMKEMDYLGKVTKNPEKPFAAILGGAKISDKIEVISNLLPKVDSLIIGGGMAYTFYKSMGLEIGKSLLEEDKIELAGELLQKGGKKIILPLDCIVSDRFDFHERKIGQLKEVSYKAIPENWYGLDIGQKSIELFRNVLRNAKTMVWNGPMGVFEIEDTARGTIALAGVLSESTQRGAITVVGGGDSASAVKKAGLEDRISHVSTGGGATLEFLEGKSLPGVEALTDK